MEEKQLLNDNPICNVCGISIHNNWDIYHKLNVCADCAFEYPNEL